MPLRRAYARNANARNTNAVALVLNHEVTNAKFWNEIKLLDQSVTNQNNQTFPNCPKCGKNHPGKCLAGKEGCFGCVQSGHRVCHQVQVAVNARSSCMLSRIARTKKILLMWSLGFYCEDNNELVQVTFDTQLLEFVKDLIDGDEFHVYVVHEIDELEEFPAPTGFSAQSDPVDKSVGINTEGTVENDLDLNGVDTELPGNEDDSDVDKELRSLMAERRNKRNPNLRKKTNPNPRKRKTILEEVPIGEAGVDRGFEDIGINKKDKYVGRLGGDDQYIDSLECDSDDNTDIKDAEAIRGVDLPGRRKSKKVGVHTSQPASHSSQFTAGQICGDTSRFKRARETTKTSQPPPFVDTSIPVTRGITSQLPPRTRQTVGQKRGRVATGEDSAGGVQKRPTNGGSSNVGFGIYTSASGTQILNPGTSSHRILPTSSMGIDLGFKPRGLRWKNKDVVTTSQLQQMAKKKKK
ncbi:hypothetical protein KY285_023522 [Solanum tuberosum]|nr:hypothetical protein KY289_023857 [Solanum tuberosum]KAH0675721.1 hypothetical protein KY285_023522 [Solanum tuberosum]